MGLLRRCLRARQRQDDAIGCAIARAYRRPPSRQPPRLPSLTPNAPTSPERQLLALSRRAQRGRLLRRVTPSPYYFGGAGIAAW